MRDADIEPLSSYGFGRAETPVHIAGALVLLSGLVTLLTMLSQPEGGAFIVSVIIDGVIGFSLLKGNARFIWWARIRLGLGLLLWGGSALAEENFVGAGLVALTSGGLLMLLIPVRQQAAIIASAAAVVVANIVILALSLGVFNLAYLGSLGEEAIGTIDTPDYRISIEASGWSYMAEENAKALNPAVGTWLVHPKTDSHVQVIFETLAEDQYIDHAALEEVAVQNASTRPRFRSEVNAENTRRGTLREFSTKPDGSPSRIRFRTRFVVSANRAAQIIVFAPDGMLHPSAYAIQESFELSEAPIETRRGFSDARSRHETQLPNPERSWQPGPRLRKQEGLRVVRYKSQALKLKAWLKLPEHEKMKTEAGYPVLVYLHGGFALDYGDFEATKPFREAGFAVLAPAYRGENDNPGLHELGYGELEDAKAAIRRIASIPDLDAERVAVTGHSAGGMLTSLLSLDSEPKVVDIGSIGGLYDDSIFSSLPIPFDPDDAEERQLRLALYWPEDVQQPHQACVGRSDPEPYATAYRFLAATQAAGTPFEVVEVDGSHGSSIGPCIQIFLNRVLTKLK